MWAETWASISQEHGEWVIGEPGTVAIMSEDLSSSINRDNDKLHEMTGESPGARELWAQASGHFPEWGFLHRERLTK